MALQAQHCLQLDDWLDSKSHGVALRDRFAKGEDGILYMDANSIGPMPIHAPEKILQFMDVGWRQMRRRGWTHLDWLKQPQTLGQDIAHLIGASKDAVRVADTTSINLYKLLHNGLAIQSPKRTIVLQRHVFPSNAYVPQGIEKSGQAQLRYIDDISELQNALAPQDVAVVALSHVDYRSSQRLSMEEINPMVHANGALSLWDLSHSLGAVRIELEKTRADMAVACGYKYLCGGPGAPSVMYVGSHLSSAHWPAICGWMGHADTFAFDADYQKSLNMDQFLVGTPSVLANTSFSCATEIWRDVSVDQLNERHESLTQTLIQLLQEQCNEFDLEISSPLVHAQRGGHVSLRMDGAANMAQAMISKGVVLSARKPDSLRIALHPLNTSHMDVWKVVSTLRDLLDTKEWKDPRFVASNI